MYIFWYIIFIVVVNVWFWYKLYCSLLYWKLMKFCNFIRDVVLGLIEFKFKVGWLVGLLL